MGNSNREQRSLRQISKIISRAQKNGIRDGDPCPRCGRPTMSGRGNNGYVSEIKAYICQDCQIEHSLVCFTDEEGYGDYHKWVLYDEEIMSSQTKNSPTVRAIIPIFQEGDRVIDTRGDWPGTVVHALPQGGLYEVMPDGGSEISVLKDKDLTFEMDEDLEHYVQTVKARIQPGMSFVIERIISTIGDNHTGMTGEVIEVLDDGGVSVRFSPSDVIVLYPDTDRFRCLGEEMAIEPEPEGSFSFDEDEFQIEF